MCNGVYFLNWTWYTKTSNKIEKQSLNYIKQYNKCPILCKSTKAVNNYVSGLTTF